METGEPRSYALLYFIAFEPFAQQCALRNHLWCVIMKVVKTKYMDFDGKEALNRSSIQQLNYGASLGNRMIENYP